MLSEKNTYRGFQSESNKCCTDSLGNGNSSMTNIDGYIVKENRANPPLEEEINIETNKR